MATIKKTFTVKNKSGLHARPAALFVQIANKFDSRITVRREDDNEEVNGKSIMGIMMLEAGKGSKVTVSAKGENAEEAISELEKLLLSETEDFTL